MGRSVTRHVSLWWLESVSYWVFWSSCTLYSLVNIHLASMRFKPQLSPSLFSGGCRWIPMEMDTSDFHWVEGSVIYVNLLGVMFGQAFLAEGLGRWFGVQTVKCLYMLIGYGSLLWNLGSPVTSLLLLQPTLILILYHQLGKKKIVIWILVALILIGQEVHPINTFKVKFMGKGVDSYHYHMVQGWLLLRCVSFFCDQQEKKIAHSLQMDLFHLYSYALYLPFLPGGPIITYNDFEMGLESRPLMPWTLSRIKSATVCALRVFVAFLLAEWWQHFIFSSAIATRPDLINELSAWEIVGLGYAFSQLYYLQYSFFFGIPHFFGTLEGFKAPQPPKCLSRMYRFSDIWRHFDPGFHRFVVKYIYIPLVGSQPTLIKKLSASGLVFGAMAMWHGTMDFILVWVTLNFICLSAERVAEKVSSMDAYQHWERNWFNPIWARRFHAALYSPLQLLSLISTFFFFTDLKGGLQFAKVILVEVFPTGTILFLLALYCLAQVGMDVHNWEMRSGKKKQ